MEIEGIEPSGLMRDILEGKAAEAERRERRDGRARNGGRREGAGRPKRVYTIRLTEESAALFERLCETDNIDTELDRTITLGALLQDSIEQWIARRERIAAYEQEMQAIIERGAQK
jgi:hypothetical protein